MKKKFKNKILIIIGAIILIIIDQVIKLWVDNNLKPIGIIKVMPGFLNFTYVENTGAAFGMFQNGTFILGIVSAIILALILIAFILNKFKSNFLNIVMMLIFAGGFGNVIDRLTRGYVIDYLDLDISLLKNFPVFNFADCCVTVGAFLLLICIFITETKKEKSLE